MDLERNKNHFGAASSQGKTSTVTSNNFKLNNPSKQTNFGTGIISNSNQSGAKPALFNFAIKPANPNNPNLSTRKFGGDNISNNSLNAAMGNSNNSNNISNNNSSNNVVPQANSGSINLFDFSEPANLNNNNNFNATANSNNNINNNFGNVNNNNAIDLLGDINSVNNNANNANKNLNLDPFDIINSLGNNNSTNSNSVNNNNFNNNVMSNSNNSSQTNLFGVDISKPNNADKAQNLLEAMYANNNNNNNNQNGFVDFSKQGNPINMNQGYINQNQFSLGMPANQMINNNDMMYNGMNPGNNQM